MFLGHSDPLVRGMDPDPSLHHAKKKNKKNLDSYYFVTIFDFFIFEK
jgi:hypothetical protein